MRTLVTFQSSAFNTTETREHYINPGCFGDDLCEWMVARLKENGVEAQEPGQEDFGWYFYFTISDGEHCFITGYRPEDDEDAGTWIGWLEKSKGLLSSLFGGRSKGISPAAAAAIHSVLSASPDIRNVRWHEKADFDRGLEEGSPTP